MSECVCIHDANDKHVGNICFPGPFEYTVVAHRRWARKNKVVGREYQTIADAFAALGTFIEEHWRSGDYNQALIIAREREITYYDPHVVYEVRPGRPRSQA